MGLDKVKLNNAGFRKLRTLPKVQADLLRRGERIAQASGPGYRAEAAPSKNRARVTVFPDTPQAVRDNAENNTLVRNLDEAG
jgi:hypothetical protein